MRSIDILIIWNRTKQKPIGIIAPAGGKKIVEIVESNNAVQVIDKNCAFRFFCWNLLPKITKRPDITNKPN